MKSKHHFYIGAALTVFLVNSVWGGKSFRDYQRELLDQSQSEFLQKRLSRDFFPDKKPGSTAGNFIPAPLPTLDSLADFKVNQDPFSATYPQTHPRVIIFPSKSILAVWEETRNGDYDIYAQKYDSNGVALGSNFQVNFETNPVDQYQPDVGVDQSGRLVVVWVDDDSLEIFARRFDSTLAPLGPSFKVNTGPGNTTKAPAIAVSASGAFVVVWEDISSVFYNVYGQFYDASGTPVGSNFKINSDLGFFPHLRPRAEYNGSGNLVVVWEDYRSGEADIYFQRYDSSGSAVDTNILVTTDVASENQFLPDIDRAFDGRFVITYMDTRDGDLDIYLQRYSAAAVAGGSAVKVNNDAGSNEHWDPAVGSDSLNRFVVAWADYRSTPAIYAQNYDSAGNTVGSNSQISSLGAAQERFSTGIDRHRKGNYFIAWQDRRSDNFDIYGQRFSASETPVGINFKLNDDNFGAFQKDPAIITTPNGNFYIAWEDYRSGYADIFLRGFNRFGNPLFTDTKVNSDVTLTDQVFPDIAADKSGNILVTWWDLGPGSRIMGQFYNSALSPIGSNLKISDDTGSVVHYRPACAATGNGKFMVAWSDNRDVLITQNIYGQIFSGPGTFSGSNFKINDDTSSSDHLNPRIGADTSSAFVVVWQDSRTGPSRIFGKAYNVNGTPDGPSEAIQSDSANTVQYLPDISLSLQAGVIVWLEDRAAGTNIFAQRYVNGIPLGPNLAIADPSLGLPRNPRVAMDKNEAFFVTWEDNRNGDWDIFGQFYYASNDSAGPDLRVNSEAGSNLQLTPDVALARDEAYLAWADNRTPGSGLDIYARLVSYLGVDVKQPRVDLVSLPKEFLLLQNYPNPFNLTTQIGYALPRESEVQIRIYDVLGRQVKVFELGRQSAGFKIVAWDGKNDRGEEVSSGIYFYSVKAGEVVQIRKMTLLK